jgi:HlyD family secretion protein
MPQTPDAPSTHDYEPYLSTAPAPWAARGLAGVLVALAGVGLVTAILVEVPESVRAPFVLVPVGGADPIRAPRGGSVAAVRVVEGGPVRQGDPVVVLRAASVGAGRAEIDALQRRAADGRERLTLERERDASQAGADAAEARRLEARLAHLRAQAVQARARRPIQDERHRSRMQGLEAEIATLRRELEFKAEHLAVSRDVAERHRIGYERHFISWVEYARTRIEAERVGTDQAGLERRLEAAHERRAQLVAERRAEELETTLAIDGLEAEARDAGEALDRLRHEAIGRRAAGRERARGLREEMDRDAIRTAALRRDLADSSGNEQVVPAPCTGTVLRLGARAPGAVVQEGDLLAEVACAGTPLMAELALPGAGVARLRAGLDTKLFFDAFPYQRHGARAGRVTWVSPAPVSSGAGAPTGFRAHVESGERAVRIDGRMQPLMAGMTGQADIVVGRRTLIAYAFEPLRALRENLGTGGADVRPVTGSAPAASRLAAGPGQPAAAGKP